MSEAEKPPIRKERTLSPWQARARATGLQQKTLAQITGSQPIVVSQQLRGFYGEKGEPPRYIAALVVAWELMSIEQREEWLAQLGTRNASVVLPISGDQIALCEQIRNRREALGLTREQVGNAVGATRHQIKALEDGVDAPLSFALAVASAVGLSLVGERTAALQGIVGRNVEEPRPGTFDDMEEEQSDEPEYEIGDELPDDIEIGR
ncbi:hypothetical protein Brsp07_04610 [Brucella sp. NBRC 14130]|uniref:helix-turn-helix domain-containing protein n=1 Tax=Brucella sp. NBRC 14130 TaxID=3075483 RepID=UPI0030B5BD17